MRNNSLKMWKREFDINNNVGKLEQYLDELRREAE